MNFTKIRLQFESRQIQLWLKDNDYIINKHVLSEYTDDDERWTTYLQERAEKLARYNELEHILLTTEWVDDVIPEPIEEVVEEPVETIEDYIDEVIEDVFDPTFEEIEEAAYIPEAVEEVGETTELETTEGDLVDDEEESTTE